MDRTAQAGVMVIATGVAIAGLYWFRDVLTPFALAMILWLAIDGLARWLDAKIPFMPRWLALPIAIAMTFGLFGAVAVVVIENVGGLTANTGAYQARLDALAAQAHAALGAPGSPPTVSGLLQSASPTALLTEIAEGLQSVAGNLVFILIYLAFIFAAAGTFPKKLDAIFGYKPDRAHARRVFSAIRLSMERYLWVQTIASLIISSLTYATLLAIGLENALFWSFVIFFLNYIPTIGSIVAVALPTLFALVQFPDPLMVGLVAAGVGLWQFVIGNFLQPRMTAESLNLSTIVVLLALALWGSLWGIAGAFLAAPLTVMAMIVLAQFRSTRWLAVLLSADGEPKFLRGSDDVSTRGNVTAQ